MTVIKYKINNQTGRDLIADDWASAQTLKAQTQAEEIAQLNWWGVIAQITNNDGSTVHCGIDANGNPIAFDEVTFTTGIYIDRTTAPE